MLLQQQSQRIREGVKGQIGRLVATSNLDRWRPGRARFQFPNSPFWAEGIGKLQVVRDQRDAVNFLISYSLGMGNWEINSPMPHEPPPRAFVLG